MFIAMKALAVYNLAMLSKCAPGFGEHISYLSEYSSQDVEDVGQWYANLSLSFEPNILNGSGTEAIRLGADTCDQVVASNASQNHTGKGSIDLTVPLQGF
jgi:hypothetical protein